MSDDLNKKIQRWKEMRHASHRWHSLLEKREALHKEIVIVEQNIDFLLFQQEQDNQTNLSHQIQEKKSVRELLIAKMRELDALLDILEDQDEESKKRLENEVIQEILSSKPALQQEYKDLEFKLASNQREKIALQGLLYIYTQIEECLMKVVEARKDIRRRGILSYIFGLNPNVIITQQLRNIEKLIATAIPELKKYQEKNIEYQAALDFLQELEIQSKQRWGFRQLDTQFVPAYDKAQEIRRMLQKLLDNNDNEQKTLIEKKEKWIEGFLRL